MKNKQYQKRFLHHKKECYIAYIKFEYLQEFEQTKSSFRKMELSSFIVNGNNLIKSEDNIFVVKLLDQYFKLYK